MNRIEEMKRFNHEFVKNKEYKAFETSKYPDQKILILTCMDTRLVELLPKALHLKNGDVKMIKNAGAMITSPTGSIMRSILVSIYLFDVKEILVIGHTECGMCNLDTDIVLSKMKEQGIEVKEDLKEWIHGFDSIEGSILDTVELIKTHPLVPKDTTVVGFIIDSHTGELKELKR